MDPEQREYSPFFLRFLASGFDWIFVSLFVSVLRIILVLFLPIHLLSSSLILLTSYAVISTIYNVFFSINMARRWGRNLSAWKL